MDSNTDVTKKTWIAIILLAFSGQLAWGVENQFFNTFMYDKITPDPRPISWMVAALRWDITHNSNKGGN